MAISGKSWIQPIPRKGFNNTKLIYIKDNMLELNDILMIPYQEMKQEDYYNYVYC